MTVFISYARTEGAAAARLAADLGELGYTVWYDADLVGGDDWWNEILRQISSCELFVLALGPRSAASRACGLELDWATRTGRPILPVVVDKVEPEATPGLDVTQAVPYQARTFATHARLARAAFKLAGTGTLPIVPPTPVPPPVSHLGPLIERIRAVALPAPEQQAILDELIERTRDDDQLTAVRALTAQLAARQGELVGTVGREVGALLRRLPTDNDDEMPLFVPSDDDETAARDRVRSILTHLIEQKCTPVLGLGVTESLVGRARRLARDWGHTVEFALADHLREDLSQVAQFVNVVNGRATLNSGFRDHLQRAVLRRHPGLVLPEKGVDIDGLLRTVWDRHGANAPDDPHAVLASLGCPIYVSAHPADLLAHALQAAGREPVVEICRWRPGVYDWPPSVFETEPGYQPTIERPLVYHPFGRLAVPDSLVITQDEGFDFLIAVTKNRDLVPLVVREALADTALLLLGFDLDDNDIGLIMRTLFNAESRGRMEDYTHLAVQSGLADAAVPARARYYLERYFQKVQKPPIEIFWGPLEAFLSELQSQRAVTA